EDLLTGALDALRAVEADRGLVHARRADGPLAALAAHAGAPVAVSVAGLDLGRHGARRYRRPPRSGLRPRRRDTSPRRGLVSWDRCSVAARPVLRGHSAAALSWAGGTAGNPPGDRPFDVRSVWTMVRLGSGRVKGF